MKRVLSLILCLAIAAATLAAAIPLRASAYEVTLKVNGVNRYRENGELIIYDSANGKTTASNEWGAEAVIGADNKCISVDRKGNSEIPAGGFVVSGHNNQDDRTKDQNADNVMEYIAAGSYVYFDKGAMTITVTDTPKGDNGPVDYTVTKEIDGTNVYREAGKIIIYKNVETTETNEWGIEAIVKNGIVVSVGGNNNAVPTGMGCFVISGNGDGMDWIRDNIKVGMAAKLDGTTLTLTYGSATLTYRLELAMQTLEDKYNAAVSAYRMFDSNAAKEKIEALKKDAEKATADFESDKDAGKYERAVNSVESEAAVLALTFTESRPAGYRGVWLRPTQSNAAEVEELVEKLYDAGINMISVEAIFNNYVITSVPEGSLFETNPQWKSFDILNAYIKACRDRGMEIHLWMSVYNVGTQNREDSSACIAYKKPEWQSVNSEGKTLPSDSDGNFYMIDPANTEAKECLLGYYEHILKNYDIDVFELDYIRYFARAAEDWGYNEGLVKGFEEKYGFTPKYDYDKRYTQDWRDYRASFVTDMVHSIRELVDATAPNVKLAVDVVPEKNLAYNDNYQYYEDWLADGIIDILHPMCYDEGYDARIAELNGLCGEKTLLCIGLGAYAGKLTSRILAAQAVYNEAVGTDGSAFFEAGNFLLKMSGSDLDTLYAARALAPLDKNAAKLLAENEIKRIRDYILASGVISGDEAEKVISAYEKLTKAKVSNASVEELREAINTYVRDRKANEVLIGGLNSVLRVLNANGQLVDGEIPDEESSAADDITSAAGDESTPADASSGGTNGIGTTAIIIICITVLLVAGAVVAFVLIKRKK